MPNNLDLPALLERPEGETLDFKEKSYDLSDKKQKRNFAKDLASLVNTPRAGRAYIVLGVQKQFDGSFKLTGIDRHVDDADLQSVAHSHLEPCPRFNYQVVPYGTNHLGLITIPAGQGSPVAPKKTLDNGFVEGSIYFRRGSQNAAASTRDQERIWAWFHAQGRSANFHEALSEPASAAHTHLNAEALLLGPIQALGLMSSVEEAQRLAANSPAEAAAIYSDVAEALHEKFPVHADQFEVLRATALSDAGDAEGCHDLLMKIAIRDLFERAKPRVSTKVAHALGQVRRAVDEVRRARGDAVILFGRSHEQSAQVQKLAECFETLGQDDAYAPAIAVLLAEAAVAYRAFEVVLDRNERLLRAGDAGEATVRLRVRAALGDAGVSGVWPDLITEAESLRFPAPEGAYVCLRGARWHAGNGQIERAEFLYRLAMKLGAEVGLDLDVGNALWSLTALYSLRFPSEELFETHQLALSVKGSRSFVTRNPLTSQLSYEYIVEGKLPDAHLWTRYRLLESIRCGSLTDELASHATLARIYSQSDEPLNALEHAILGGSHELVKEIAPQVRGWPGVLADFAVSRAPWVRRSALLALEHVGDLAPPEAARALVPELLRQFRDASDDRKAAPLLLKALGSIVLEASDAQLAQLIPVLMQAAVRERDVYRLTDPGVLTIAARLYRFRPTHRRQAASILSEMAVGAHTGEWSHALYECGKDTGELVEAFKRVARREQLDLTGSFSELGHLNGATRALWSQRLKFVDDYPLGSRSRVEIRPPYDVRVQFLREQDTAVVVRYVDKLVSIGSNVGEPAINREDALSAAGNVVNVLPVREKQKVFGRVRTLVEGPIQISELDQYEATTQHPLSRFRVSFGGTTDVLSSAGRLLGLAAIDPEDCSLVVRMALKWMRSDDPILQETGASLLTLPTIFSSDVQIVELANHPNAAVRQVTLRLPSTQVLPEAAVFEQLASDPDRGVRITVAQVLQSTRLVDLESYERIRAGLSADPSAIVRAFASRLARRCDPTPT